METADRLLNLLTTHWKVLGLLIIGFTAGGYRIARWRTSGLRKVVNAHEDILDDLSTRLNSLRLELENTREELSKARVNSYEAISEVARLTARVRELEIREQELLLKIETQ